MKYITYVDRVDKTEQTKVATSDSITETIGLLKPYIESDEYIVTTICSDGTFVSWVDIKSVLSREYKLKKRNEVKFVCS